MDSNYGQVGQSWEMSSQAPLDSKSMVNSLLDLTDLGTGNTKPFLYYRGMKIYCHQDRNTYEWTDNLSANQTTLLPNNFTYPSGSTYDNINYSGLEFNFVKIEVQYTNRTDFLESEGTGVEVFNGVNPTSGNSKIARLNSSTQKITKQGDGSVNSEIDIFNRGSDDAVSFYEFFPVTKLHAVSKIKSNNIIITKDNDGNVVINTPGGGSSSSDWYLDIGFQRPSNWNTPQNPKEKITYLSSMSEIASGVYTNGEEIPVPSGALNDPFKSYEEYLLKRIYGADGANGTGTQSKVNPRHSGITLQILSYVSTASEIEVNNTTLMFKNKSPIFYTGTRDYAIDYKSIYDVMPVDGFGKALYPMNNKIIGEGYITRQTGFGLLRAKAGSKTLDGVPAIHVVGEGEFGFIFQEGENLASFAPVFKKDGVTPLMNEGSPVLGWQQVPTTPLIIIDGQTPPWTALMGGTKVFVITKTQVGIELINKATLTSSADKFMYQVSNTFIGYEKKLLDTGSYTSEEREIVNYFSPEPAPGIYSQNPGVFYKPYSGYSIFKAGEESEFRIENLSTEPNGFHAFAAMNTFEGANKSQFSALVSFSNIGGGTTLNLLKKNGSDGYFSLNNGQSTTPYFNLIEGDTTNTFPLILRNISLITKNYKNNIISTSFNTNGTLSTINGVALMTQLPVCLNNIDALLNLVPGMLYKVTGTKEVKQVE